MSEMSEGVRWCDGDLDKSIEISCRGGFDSDCNPSSAAGVVFTTVGFSKLAGSRFTPEENEKILFAPCERGGLSEPKKAE